MFSDSEMYNIPECLLSVRREASCAYAGLGNKYASDINRESYLQLLRTTRLNKKDESRVSTVTADISRLDSWLIVSVAAIVILLAAIIIFNYRKRKYITSYSNELKRLPDVCRRLFSSLPQDIGSKDDLCAHIAGLLNESFVGFSGDVQFAFNTCAGGDAHSYSFVMKYIAGGSDTLYVTATQPLTPGKYSLLEMLVPYVAVAVGEGMRLADIGNLLCCEYVLKRLAHTVVGCCVCTACSIEIYLCGSVRCYLFGKFCREYVEDFFALLMGGVQPLCLYPCDDFITVAQYPIGFCRTAISYQYHVVLYILQIYE